MDLAEIHLTVTDDKYTNDSYSETIYVNKPPNASFYFRPKDPKTNETVQFISTSRDEDGNIISHYWDFGDGSEASGRLVNHSYSSVGDYTVTLTVRDNLHAKNSTQNFTFKEKFI